MIRLIRQARSGIVEARSLIAQAKRLTAGIERSNQLFQSRILAFLHALITDVHDGFDVNITAKVDRDGLKKLLAGETDKLPFSLKIKVDIEADADDDSKEPTKLIDQSKTMRLNCSTCGNIDAVISECGPAGSPSRAACPTCGTQFIL